MIVENEILPASYEMIKYACKNYHYSASIPRGKLMGFSIFEEKNFVGVFVFSMGANNNIAEPFKLLQGEVIELTRIALKKHKNPVTFYLSRCIKLIKKFSPSVKMIVSYSDIDYQNHVGKIYQANNWLYLGVIKGDDRQYFYKGKWTHERTLTSFPADKRNILRKVLPSRKNSDKFKYIFPMTKNLFREWRKKSKPYPKNIYDR